MVQHLHIPAQRQARRTSICVPGHNKCGESWPRKQLDRASSVVARTDLPSLVAAQAKWRIFSHLTLANSLLSVTFLGFAALTRQQVLSRELPAFCCF
jgi:hypothetical protein